MVPRSRSLLPMVMFPLLASAGCTDVSLQTFASASQAIIGGTAEPGFPGVALVVFNPQTDHGVCTGVLVDSRHVVTMGFCLYEGVTSIQVSFTGDSGTLLHQDSATTLALSPDYNGNTPVSIAVLRLASAVPGTVTPPTLYDGTLTSSLVGQQVLLVGFGTSNPMNDNSGTKRSARVPVTAVSTDVFTWNGSSANGCWGDSGGPTLLDVGGGQMAVIGLDAYGDQNCNVDGNALRWDVVRSFVADAIAGRLDGGTRTDASGGEHDASTGIPDAGTGSHDAGTGSQDAAGAADEDDSGGGCGCSTSAEGGPSLLLIALALLAIGARRPRATR